MKLIKVLVGVIALCLLLPWLLGPARLRQLLPAGVVSQLHNSAPALVPYLVGEQKNLIIISLDTLRADRLGMYGYDRPTSPTLDSFSEGAVVFDQAIAPSPWTLPSHASLFSGLYPTSHGATMPERGKIPPTVPLLAEVLHDQGYVSYGVTGGGYVTKGFGLARGFDDFKIIGRDKRRGSSRKAIKRGIEFIETASQGTKPYFLFLHTYDIHCPYTPPEPFASMFVSSDAEEIDPTRCGPHYNAQSITPQQARYLSDRYDGSIRWVDSELAVFFDYLKEAGQLEKSIVVIVSDHGEEFSEHGRIGHKMSLHRELLHIPLIVRVPGLAGYRVPASVNLTDVFPTVLELLGVSLPTPVDGASLVALFDPTTRDKSAPPRPFQFSELDRGVKLRSRYEPKEQLIVNIESGSCDAMTFNGPKEERTSSGPCSEEQPHYQELKEFMRGLSPRIGDESDPVSKKRLEQLRSLGYL